MQDADNARLWLILTCEQYEQQITTALSTQGQSKHPCYTLRLLCAADVTLTTIPAWAC